MVDMLGFISDQLDQLGIPYEFGEWTGISIILKHQYIRL